MHHDSRLKAPAPPTDQRRMGAMRAILTLIGGVIALNLAAVVNQRLAVVLAVSVIAAAVAVFFFTLLRKN